MKDEQTSVIEFDLIIAGGAMTGAALALAVANLTQQGLKIAVVEGLAPDNNHLGYDARSIALSLGSILLLKRIDIWHKLSLYATAIKSIHVSDKGHFAQNNIYASDEGVPYLGAVVELADAGAVFHEALNKYSNIQMFCPSLVTKIERSIDKVSLRLSSGQTLSSRLLVAADGATSSCANMLNLTQEQYDFKQSALIANVTTSLSHQGRAFERFTKDGPVALLPMSKDRSSLVWCVTSEKAAQLLCLNDEDFTEQLQQCFGWRLGSIVQLGQRHHYPLLLRQRSQLISHRVVLIGNAAQTLHPIAGQGFNLGLRDVFSLAEEITVSYQNQQDIGAMNLLQRYQKRRYLDRNATIAMTSILVHAFSNTIEPIILTRNLALAAMSICPQLKIPLLKRTMGLVKR